MARENMFSIPIWKFKDLEFNDNELERHAYLLKSKDPESRNPEGYSTISKDQRIRGVKWKSYQLGKKDYIGTPALDKAVSTVTGIVEQCFKELQPKSHVSIELEACWYNIYAPGVGMEIHPHPGNVISAIYYIKSKEGSGDIVYFNPDVSAYYNYSPKYFFDRNDITAVKYFYSPVVGTLICAPSHIQHAVGINMSDEDRICLVFNFKVKDDNPHTPNHKLFKY